jgi:uncharacterized protein
MALPDYPLFFWLCAAFVALLIGIDKSGFGGGIGVIATPLIALSIPVAEAAALVLPILIFGDILAVSHYRRKADAANLWLLLPCLIVGVIIGTLFFRYFADNKRILNVGTAVIALGFVVFQLSRENLFKRLEHTRPSKPLGILLGTVAGFTSMIAHVGGPLVVIYLLPQNLGKDVFVGTNAILFFVTNVIKLIPYSLLGLFHMGNIPTILILLPLTWLGNRIGVFLNQRFSNLWFNRVIYVLLTLTALQLFFRR